MTFSNAIPSAVALVASCFISGSAFADSIEVVCAKSLAAELGVDVEKVTVRTVSADGADYIVVVVYEERPYHCKIAANGVVISISK